MHKININSNTISTTNNESNRLLHKMINTDDRTKNKKILNNNLYTPKRVEKSNKIVIVNKKINKAFTNQRLKNYKILKKNNDYKFTKNNAIYNNNNSHINNNLINYSLSYTHMTNKNRNNISSNYHNNYNTKRNINLEKFKTNNFRKDSYCTSIEKKRKALGLQFKPDLEKELSIQNDQKAYRKNIISNLLKHKIIKVNKRDENSTSNMNMEGINATPQRFRILKKTENRNNFVKNKTTTNFNFNYAKKSFNCNISIINRNSFTTNNLKINNIHPNYSLSENNNNSSSKIMDSNLIFITNKTNNNN